MLLIEINETDLQLLPEGSYSIIGVVKEKRTAEIVAAYAMRGQALKDLGIANDKINKLWKQEKK